MSRLISCCAIAAIDSRRGAWPVEHGVDRRCRFVRRILSFVHRRFHLGGTEVQFSGLTNEYLEWTDSPFLEDLASRSYNCLTVRKVLACGNASLMCMCLVVISFVAGNKHILMPTCSKPTSHTSNDSLTWWLGRLNDGSSGYLSSRGPYDIPATIWGHPQTPWRKAFRTTISECVPYYFNGL